MRASRIYNLDILFKYSECRRSEKLTFSILTRCFQLQRPCWIVMRGKAATRLQDSIFSSSYLYLCLVYCICSTEIFVVMGYTVAVWLGQSPNTSHPLDCHVDTGSIYVVCTL